jgi:hypothetical protein
VPDQTSAAFISYCRDDEEFALRLAQDLKDAGAAVWLDQLDIKPGHSWDNAVEIALRAATKMLVILTPTSVSSENVRDEIAYALKQGKIVIPVLYIECEIPLRLERKQHIDFRANYARGVDRLLRELSVEPPDKAAVERAAEDEAQRRLASQAHEAERLRLEEQARQERAREAEAERLREEEQVKQERVREAEAYRLRQEQARQEAARQAREETLRREQELKQQSAPPQSTSAGSRPQEAKPQSDVKAAPFRPWLWRRSSWTGLAGGFAAILIVGFIFFRPSPSSHSGPESQPGPVVVQETPQPAKPELNPTAPPPSPSGSKTTSQGSLTREQKPAPESKPDFAALAAQGLTLFFSNRYAEALPLFTQACDGGDGGGCYGLAALYEDGKGVAKDYGKVKALYTKACDSGYLAGCSGLGALYEDGKGVSKNYRKANTLYTKACDGGSGDGCFNLALLYEDGMGVPKDHRKANTLYTKACDGGNTDGCCNLGVSYENGTGVPQDYGKARTLYTKACAGLVAAGCSYLGDLYRTGHGVAVNAELARQYLKKGCDMGNTWGCDRLKEMK